VGRAVVCATLLAVFGIWISLNLASHAKRHFTQDLFVIFACLAIIQANCIELALLGYFFCTINFQISLLLSGDLENPAVLTIFKIDRIYDIAIILSCTLFSQTEFKDLLITIPLLLRLTLVIATKEKIILLTQATAKTRNFWVLYSLIPSFLVLLRVMQPLLAIIIAIISACLSALLLFLAGARGVWLDRILASAFTRSVGTIALLFRRFFWPIVVEGTLLHVPSFLLTISKILLRFLHNGKPQRTLALWFLFAAMLLLKQSWPW